MVSVSACSIYFPSPQCVWVCRADRVWLHRSSLLLLLKLFAASVAALLVSNVVILALVSVSLSLHSLNPQSASHSCLVIWCRGLIPGLCGGLCPALYLRMPRHWMHGYIEDSQIHKINNYICGQEQEQRWAKGDVAAVRTREPSETTKHRQSPR